MRNFTRSIVLGLSLGVALPALANDPAKPATTASKPARDTKKATSNTDADLKLMTQIAQTSMREIDLSKAAATAQRKETRELAQTLIKGHTIIADELAALAQARTVELPTMMDEDARKATDKLSQEKGIDLDRKYVSLMVEDHEDAVQLFEKAAKHANDPELKAWAAKKVASVENQHKMALDVKTKLESLTKL